MSKKVLVLSGSPRVGGNSDLLCDEFIKGAAESGNDVEKINVGSKKIGYCRACYYCEGHGGECAIKDDMAEILEKMIAADVIVFASPVYFYSIAAQLKALIDRTLARWLEIHDKDFYYIVTAGVDYAQEKDATPACFHGFAECLEGINEKGLIYAAGVYGKGEVIGRPEMQQAYEMGKNV